MTSRHQRRANDPPVCLRGRKTSAFVAALLLVVTLFFNYRFEANTRRRGVGNPVFECSSAPHSSDTDFHDVLRVGTPSTGRLGNHIRFYRWAVYEAMLSGCHISLPIRISTLNLSSSCPFLRNSRAVVGTSYKCRAVHEIADFDDHLSYKVRGSGSLHVMDALQKYTSSREFRRKRFAYGIPCPAVQYAAIQIRSGDTFRGRFDASGAWRSWPTYRQYAPFPTSYYLSAFKSVLARVDKVQVICERPTNIACAYFQKLQVFFEDELQVRFDKDILNDVRAFTCSSEVVASRGSFHESFHLHSSQVLHDFVDDRQKPTTSVGKNQRLQYQTKTNNYSTSKWACVGNRVLHFQTDFDGAYRSIVGEWNNTSVQHTIVDKMMAVSSVNCIQ